MRSLRPVGPAALVVTVGVVLLAGELPPVVRYGPLLASVVLLGLPHGAVDHVAVARGLRTRSGGDGTLRRAMRSVALLYAVAGGAYLLLWIGFPIVAALGFLLLTWFHWGQGDLYHLLATGGGAHLDTRVDRALSLVVRGGLPMLVPLLNFPEVYRRVVTALAAVFVAAPSVPDWPFAFRTRLALGVGFALVTLAALLLGRLGVGTAEERRAWYVDAGEVLLQWVFFLLVPPVLAIGVYFTLWHSVRHIRRIAALGAADRGIAPLDRPAMARFARTALPNTVGALLVLVAIYTLGSARGGLLAVAAAYLVTIAVLTLPHTVVVTWLDARQGVWTVE